jgi:hypothetical protein
LRQGKGLVAKIDNIKKNEGQIFCFGSIGRWLVDSIKLLVIVLAVESWLSGPGRKGEIKYGFLKRHISDSMDIK